MDTAIRIVLIIILSPILIYRKIKRACKPISLREVQFIVGEPLSYILNLDPVPEEIINMARDICLTFISEKKLKKREWRMEGIPPDRYQLFLAEKYEQEFIKFLVPPLKDKIHELLKQEEEKDG